MSTAEVRFLPSPPMRRNVSCWSGRKAKKTLHAPLSTSNFCNQRRLQSSLDLRGGSMLWLCSVAPARLLPLCPVAPAITAAKWACAQETYSNRKGYRSSGLIKDIIVKVFQLVDFLLSDADGSEWASRRFPSTERKREFVVGNDWKRSKKQKTVENYKTQAARVLCSTSQPFAAVVCNTSHHNIELGTS